MKNLSQEEAERIALIRLAMEFFDDRGFATCLDRGEWIKVTHARSPRTTEHKPPPTVTLQVVRRTRRGWQNQRVWAVEMTGYGKLRTQAYMTHRPGWAERLEDRIRTALQLPPAARYAAKGSPITTPYVPGPK